MSDLYASALTWEQSTVRKKSQFPQKKCHFLGTYIKGISPDQYGVHAHCKRTNIVKIPSPLCDVRETHSCLKKFSRSRVFIGEAT
jgi:hypothetical protein